MPLNPFKQKTCEGCLPACLLTLIGKKVTLNSELKLITGGFKKYRDAYAPGIILEFANKYRKTVKVLVDGNFYYKKLLKIANPRVQIGFKRINSRFLNKVSSPFILYIDNEILTSSVHWPHFVIVERKHNNKFVLIDPWDGKRKWLKEERLMEGVLSLKNYLKFCPLLIKLD